MAEAGFVHGADTHDLGEQPLACQRRSCIFSDPRTHGFGTPLIEQQAVDIGSTCCHLVAGQRAGLVRADGGRGAHRLTRAQGLDQVVFLRHLVRHQCEGDD